jgi:hypothetical protein
MVNFEDGEAEMLNLNPEQQTTINNRLPDCLPVGIRIVKLNTLLYHRPAHIFPTNSNLITLNRLRIAYVCLADSVYALQNARFALGEAHAIRLYYMQKSLKYQDEAHLWADVRSRFYADYVTLLLSSSTEHVLNGILELLSLRKDVKNDKQGGTFFRKALRALSGSKYPELEQLLSEYENLRAWDKVYDYRTNWVHNKPQRVESILLNRPRHGYIFKIFGDTYAEGIGPENDYDISWEDLMEVVKLTMEKLIEVSNACIDVLEKEFNRCFPTW